MPFLTCRHGHRCRSVPLIARGVGWCPLSDLTARRIPTGWRPQAARSRPAGRADALRGSGWLCASTVASTTCSPPIWLLGDGRIARHPRGESAAWACARRLSSASHSDRLALYPLGPECCRRALSPPIAPSGAPLPQRCYSPHELPAFSFITRSNDDVPIELRGARHRNLGILAGSVGDVERSLRPSGRWPRR